MSFMDAGIPAGFAPFNIANIGGKIYVTYAKQLAPENKDDQSGPGNGYVDIYNADGTFVKRFASQGQLNSPWGMTVFKGNNSFAPPINNTAEDADVSMSDRTTILIGN